MRKQRYILMAAGLIPFPQVETLPVHHNLCGKRTIKDRCDCHICNWVRKASA